VLAPGVEQLAGQMRLAHGLGATTELWFDQSQATPPRDGRRS
jgi:hypothetical protein